MLNCLDFIMTDMVSIYIQTCKESDKIYFVLNKDTLKIMWRNKLERDNPGQEENSELIPFGVCHIEVILELT